MRRRPGRASQHRPRAGEVDASLVGVSRRGPGDVVSDNPKDPRGPRHSLRSPMSAFNQSMGTGKTTVEFFSAAISTSVCR
jgi:hypothetical protein